MLSSFGTVEQVDPVAALQQATLILALYENREDQAQQVLSIYGGGTQLLWDYKPNTFPPSYAIFQQGNAYFIIFTGTVNAKQWYLNISGAYAVPYPESNVNVHGGWYAIANQEWPLLRSYLPPDLTTGQYFISAHSYGAAIGLLVADMLVAATNPDNVQLLTIGQPRVFTTGNPPLPHVYHRIVNQGDAVTHVPVTSAAIGLGLLLLRIPVFSTFAGWQHYGQHWDLYPNGALMLNQQEDDDSGIFGSVYQTAANSAHSTKSYITNIIAGL